MNIGIAKEYIKNDVRMYLKKDEFGDYRIPVVRQRPIFLLGAPGIGKTAIMEQIAEELGIALVSYSMTHHTRQSALGLPFIKERRYKDRTYDVSEYTMSEIIAAVYETMEESGCTEGILFLDEINCVSETLAPSMLQFLQYKVFGKHRVPDGWVIVTAGNPPLYNKSVREFDVVTLDRLKVLEVEADFPTWKAYASERGIHGAIVSFLDIKRDYFYHIETLATGRTYVTARGWEDVSEIIKLYEEEGLPVDETLVGQYLQNEKIVKEFTAYYDLYNRYKNDYRVEAVLAGDISDAAVEKAKAAPFDERLSLLGLLMEKTEGAMRDVVSSSDVLSELTVPLKAVKAAPDKIDMLQKQSDARKKIIKSRESAGALSREEKKKNKRVAAFLEKMIAELNREGLQGDEAFAYINKAFQTQVEAMRQAVAQAGTMLHHMFTFCDRAFSNGNEMLVLVTALTVNTSSARFIGMFGSEDYNKFNEVLRVSERNDRLRNEIAQLEI